jgi:hypothetical protein
MIKNILTSITLLLGFIVFSQNNPKKETKKTKPFIAYELGQAIFNDFNSYSGEIGLRFNNNHILRLAHMNIKMSEAHLSSDFAVVVDGDNVEGEQFGFETFYDFPVFWEGFYLSPSFGWYRNVYSHTILDESLKKSSATIGLAISYREVDIFKVKGLYYMLSFPMRTPFNPIKKTKLGKTTIKSNVFDSNIFFFIGFEF